MALDYMTSKLKCKSCDAEILESTYSENNGLCKRCVKNKISPVKFTFESIICLVVIILGALTGYNITGGFFGIVIGGIIGLVAYTVISANE